MGLFEAEINTLRVRAKELELERDRLQIENIELRAAIARGQVFGPDAAVLVPASAPSDKLVEILAAVGRVERLVMGLAAVMPQQRADGLEWGRARGE